MCNNGKRKLKTNQRGIKSVTPPPPVLYYCEKVYPYCNYNLLLMPVLYSISLEY